MAVTEVCGHYGISRKTFYKWYGRYQKSRRDFHGLRDRSRRPHSHPRSVPKPVAERIVSLRRKTRYGPRRLAYYLAQEGITISVYGVYRVLQRQGLVRKRRSRPRKKPQSYAMAVPGQRVQVDVKHLPVLRLKGRPEPLKQYLYNAIDDCTRLQVASVSSEITPRASVQFLRRLLQALGRDGAADGRTAPAGLRHPPLRTGRATFTASGSPSDGLDWCVGNIGFSAILVGFIHPASGVVRFVPLPSDCPPSPCGRLSRPRTTTRALPHVRRWPKAGLLRCRRAGRASQVRPGCIFMPS